MLNFCQTCSSDRISLTLRNFSVLLSVALFSAVRLLSFCARLGSDASIDLNATSEQSTARELLSNLSVLLNADKPSSDHACIHKCRSDMKFRNSPVSLLPSQFLGMRSLIRYGLEPIDFADTVCNAVLMLFKMSTRRSATKTKGTLFYGAT